MKLKYKLFALTATGSLLAASFLGIQTFYTDGADTAQVSVRTPDVQSAEFFGGGVRKY